ncbi:MAG: SMC-Scp complex subunit ScpB [Candidatus Diapherotrites archaeon]
MEKLRELVRIARDWEENKKVLESALFMAPGSIELKDLAKLTSVEDKRHVEEMLAEIMKEYEEGGKGIEVVCQDGAYQMRVKPHHMEKVKHLALKAEMPKGVQRTLALIAIKQPIKQSLVVKYRNVKAYDHLKELLEAGFISKEPFGRTYLLRTTPKFKEYFGEVKPREPKQ